MVAFTFQGGPGVLRVHSERETVSLDCSPDSVQVKNRAILPNMGIAVARRSGFRVREHGHSRLGQG